MSSDINPQIQAEICSFCNRISADYLLDAEIREELRGHMEDKLVAYMNGDERLSEQDAFILVREHFGAPAVVEELLQRVHGPGTGAVRILIAAIGCVNTALGAVSLLLSLYGTVAALLIIQNAVRLVGSDRILAGPYVPLLINVVTLPQACLMLASGIALMRRNPWGRTWSFVFAFYTLAAAPLVQWIARVGGANAPGSLVFMAIPLMYALLVIAVMMRVPRKRLVSSVA